MLLGVTDISFDVNGDATGTYVGFLHPLPEDDTVLGSSLDYSFTGGFLAQAYNVILADTVEAVVDDKTFPTESFTAAWTTSSIIVT